MSDEEMMEMPKFDREGASGLGAMAGRGLGLCRTEAVQQLTEQLNELGEGLEGIEQEAPQEIKQRIASMKDKVASLKTAFESAVQQPIGLGRGRGGAGRGCGRSHRRE